MEEEIKPNYFAVIPANVRYDDELTEKAKLLYGEITCLSNKEGLLMSIEKCTIFGIYLCTNLSINKFHFFSWIHYP